MKHDVQDDALELPQNNQQDCQPRLVEQVKQRTGVIRRLIEPIMWLALVLILGWAVMAVSF